MAAAPSEKARHPEAVFRVITGTAFGSGSLRIGLQAQAPYKLFFIGYGSPKKIPAPAPKDIFFYFMWLNLDIEILYIFKKINSR